MPGDDATLAFYAETAERYAERDVAGRERDTVGAFAERLDPGATVLDFGCGGGWAAAALHGRGFDVHAIDGCAELAAIASRSLPRPVRVVSFEDFDDVEAHDGIFANGTLHHLTREALPGVLARIARALKPGGLLYASFKAGDGAERDSLGRLYTYVSEAQLRDLIDGTPGLTCEELVSQDIVDFAGVPCTILGAFARKAAKS